MAESRQPTVCFKNRTDNYEKEITKTTNKIQDLNRSHFITNGRSDRAKNNAHDLYAYLTTLNPMNVFNSIVVAVECLT